jgi:hypothetical protein
VFYGVPVDAWVELAYVFTDNLIGTPEVPS